MFVVNYLYLSLTFPPLGLNYQSRLVDLKPIYILELFLCIAKLSSEKSSTLEFICVSNSSCQH